MVFVPHARPLVSDGSDDGLFVCDPDGVHVPLRVGPGVLVVPVLGRSWL